MKTGQHQKSDNRVEYGSHKAPVKAPARKAKAQAPARKPAAKKPIAVVKPAKKKRGARR
jgi:hypothetical protein